MEANLQSNFNVGFTNMKSDVLVHLTQWQYWWWFWFSLLWAFYYLMVLKMIRFRSLKFRPRLATTFRPHGKWGDLVVCIIPVSWCANIITNSNFILRMIEWQSESGLLSVRIRGKQWYWVYKFELKTFTDVFTVPKNVGHNKWQISTPNDLQVADDYLHILQLRSQNRWAKTYWEELTKEVSKSKNFHLISPQEQLSYNFFNSYNDMTSQEVMNESLHRLYERERFNTLCNLTSDLILDLDLISFYELLDVFAKNGVELSKERFEEAFLDYSSCSRMANKINNGSSNSVTLGGVRAYLIDKIIYTEKESGEVINFDCFRRDDFFIDFIKSMASVRGLPTSFFIDLNKFLHDIYVSSLETEDEEFNFFWDTTFEQFVQIKFGKTPLIDFFKENFFSPKDDSGVDQDLGLDTEVFFDEDLAALKNSNIVFPEVDEISLSTDDSILKFVQVDFSDRRWLKSSFNENLYIRLKNKKSNWDETTSSDLFSDAWGNFLLNDEFFLNRDEQIEKKNFFFQPIGIEEMIDKFENDRENTFYNYSDFNEFDRLSRKTQGTNSPVRLIKYPVSNKTNFAFDSDVVELFRFRYNDSDVTTEHRTTPNSAFLIVRQKRYKRRKVILPRTIFYKDSEGNLTKRIKTSHYTFLSQNKIILENDFNATKRYKFFRKNKMRDELTNLVLSKRILRTRRTLVLPAHINITAITNSFDVIHSWFIPGLGLKMDAIPGRATHHTFYIDNVGFYYGQCAEICGRYHHHMPIRICALPFEHFLLWWQSFGLPKLMFTKNFRRYNYSYGSRKYAW